MMNEVHSEVMVFETPQVNTPDAPVWSSNIDPINFKRFWEMTAAEREEVCAIPKWVWVT